MNKQDNYILIVFTLISMPLVIFAGMNTRAIIVWVAIMAIVAAISLGMHIAFKLLFR